MNSLFLLSTGATGDAPADASLLSLLPVLLIYGVMGLAIYFFLFRPQSKKKKKEAAMRNSAQVGDQITTIGGIVGRIVSIREESDSIVIETGSDRSKMMVKRWSIGTVDTIRDAE